MKRSEAIKIIEETIKNTWLNGLADESPYLDENYCAFRILKMLEDNGFLPPLCERGFDRDGLSSKTPPSHRWEPENEPEDDLPRSGAV